MIRTLSLMAALAAGIFLTGCGTSSTGPSGSLAQTMSGVTESGYPGGKPTDKHSPALGSSSEQLHSREQDEERAKEAGHGTEHAPEHAVPAKSEK